MESKDNDLQGKLLENKARLLACQREQTKLQEEIKAQENELATRCPVVYVTIEQGSSISLFPAAHRYSTTYKQFEITSDVISCDSPGIWTRVSHVVGSPIITSTLGGTKILIDMKAGDQLALRDSKDDKFNNMYMCRLAMFATQEQAQAWMTKRRQQKFADI